MKNKENEKIENYYKELAKVERDIRDLWEVGKKSKAKEKRKEELEIIINYYNQIEAERRRNRIISKLRKEYIDIYERIVKEVDNNTIRF